MTSERALFTRTGTFNGMGDGPREGVVNYGDGTGDQPLVIADRKVTSTRTMLVRPTPLAYARTSD